MVTVQTPWNRHPPGQRRHCRKALAVRMGVGWGEGVGIEATKSTSVSNTLSLHKELQTQLSFLFSILCLSCLSLLPPFPHFVNVKQKGINFALILAQVREVAGPSWTPASCRGLLGTGMLSVRGPWRGRGRALRAQALSLEALPSERGTGFIRSLFQGRNRLGGGRVYVVRARFSPMY